MSDRSQRSIARRTLIAVLFALIAALQIKDNATIVEVISDPGAFPGIPELSARTLAFLNPGAASIAAGVKKGDTLIAIDGNAIHSRADEARLFFRHKPGNTVSLTLRRGTNAPFSTRYTVATALRLDRWLVLTFLILNIITPWSCILLGFLVGLRRPGDAITWPLIFLLICVSQAFRGYNDPPFGWITLFSWPGIFFMNFATPGMAACWMWFAIQFPDPRSPARVWPWTRWVLGVPFLVINALAGIYFATAVHDPTALPWLEFVSRIPDWFDEQWGLVLILIGCVNFVSKFRREKNPSLRRRLRWVSVGLVWGVFPLAALIALADILQRGLNDFPLPIQLGGMMSPILIPLTLAYAVLVDRLLDVGVFVRQGLLASKTVSAIRTIVTAGLIWLAVNLATQKGVPGLNRIAQLTACAVAMILTSRGLEWLRSWVDRHFFQEAVNTERLLTQLAGEVRGIRNPETLLSTVTGRIAEAMHLSRATAISPDAELTHTTRAGDDLLVPIVVSGERQYALKLGPRLSEEPFSGRDIALLESVAGQTGLALEINQLTATVAREAAHRERIAGELEIARTVQERLFPKAAPRVPGLDLAGRCQPAQSVGGDYFDFFTVPGSNAIGFAIGDIAGKGVPAALLMSGLQASLRGVTLSGVSDLADLMAKLNLLMYDASPANRFATFFCCLYEADTGRLRYSSAGHNPALLIRANSSEPEWLKTRGMALGLRRKASFEQAETSLHPGDCLLLYTDGVTEARNLAGDEFEEERLAATIRGAGRGSAAALVDAVLAATNSFAAGATQHDDITLIAAVRRGGD